MKTLRYLPAHTDNESSYMATGAVRGATALGTATWYADDPRVASAARAEELLAPPPDATATAS
ncbi:MULTISPECIES: hypothetical protein [unclassified Streptomyces]|uniref:hypothetical protein n=1 Tax=unclassified Streptomyces TaxID=2593676 RepID=UPI00336A8246